MNSIFLATPELIWKKAKLSVPFSESNEYAERYFFKMMENLKEKFDISHCIFVGENREVDYTEKTKNFIDKYFIDDCSIEKIAGKLLLSNDKVYILDSEILKLENSWENQLFEVNYKVNHSIEYNQYVGYKLQSNYLNRDDITKTFILKAEENNQIKILNSSYQNIEELNELENNDLNYKLDLDDYKYEVLGKKKIRTEKIESAESLSEVLSKVQSKIYFKCLYDGEKAYYGTPVSMAFGIDDLEIMYYTDFSLVLGNAEFEKLMVNSSIGKYGHHIKDDLILLKKENIEVVNLMGDSMIAAYILDPSIDDYGIDYIAQNYLDEKISSEEELLGKGKQKKCYRDIEDIELEKYLVSYVSVIARVQDKLEEKMKDLGMEQLYFDIELPLVEVLADMEYEGISVDREGLKKLNDEFGSVIIGLKSSIYLLAGREFNINSPKQLGEVLFEEIGLPVIKKTKTGYSTNAEVLDKLLDKHEIIPMILEYRKLSKLVSTYVDGLQDLIDDNGKIHSSFNQAITTTGRISSTQPNLQNIPVRTKEGRLIRKVFVPTEWRKLGDADYSQIELRVLAHISKDENLQRAYLENEDIHTKTAAEVFFVKPDAVTDNQRRVAKAVNFGIVYGISDFGLSRDLKISLKEAKTYIDAYLNLYSRVDEYMGEIIATAKEQGYVETIFGRRRYIPELSASNKNIQSFGERIALNTPIQGSAADIIKLAMVKVYKSLKEKGLKSKLVLQVHDELIIDATEDEIEVVQNLLKKEMEQVLKLDIPLDVDMKAGDSWYETK
jgi:DNA polymerase-1